MCRRKLLEQLWAERVLEPFWQQAEQKKGRGNVTKEYERLILAALQDKRRAHEWANILLAFGRQPIRDPGDKILLRAFDLMHHRSERVASAAMLMLLKYQHEEMVLLAMEYPQEVPHYDSLRDRLKTLVKKGRARRLKRLM